MKTIRDVMQPEPIQIRRDEALRAAVVLLIENEISGLPVVDDAGRLVGVLSEKDLLNIFDPAQKRTVEALMSPDPVSIPVDGQLVDVVDQLMANDFRRVFIHENGKLVGLISRSDLMPAILEALVERA
jgi:CBS domain-containing protein